MPRKTAAARPLKEYRAKRDFKSSPEPAGEASTARKKPTESRRIFCVQKHLASHLHYDFRLEHRGVMLSWAVPKGPSLNARDKRLAMRVEDHPRDYADFEGVIAEGYGAGIVMLWDNGTWEPESADIDAALEAGELKFRLDGIKLKGSWVLVRTGGGPKTAEGESRSWLLIKHKDQWAGALDVTTAAADSVKSFGDFADILSKGTPAIWNSHRPAKGGEAGAMLKAIIEEAANRKVGRPKAAPAKAAPTKSRKIQKSRHR
jgi:bifunctional non-homologous end joining protein LigD